MISVSVLWICELLLASFILALRPLDSMTKSSQVSRAKGTSHTHQSGVLKEGASLWPSLRVLLAYSATSVEMEVAAG